VGLVVGGGLLGLHLGLKRTGRIRAREAAAGGGGETVTLGNTQLLASWRSAPFSMRCLHLKAPAENLLVVLRTLKGLSVNIVDMFIHYFIQENSYLMRTSISVACI
jgi:hypothetical protein